MKVRMASKAAEDKIELQMTPMIDIVFQLLIFFILTFKIVKVEGDFNIKMPRAAPSAGMPDTPLPPMRVRMRAGEGGTLAQLMLDSRVLDGGPNKQPFVQLRREVINIVQPTGQPSEMSEAEVELDCDYDLNYQYVIEAITAVTGYIQDGQIQKLVEKVKFAQPKPPAGGG